jgi:hypothetical protein
MAWNSRVQIKHLLTEGEDLASVQRNMNAIADVIDSSSAFILFPQRLIERMRNIPAGDDVVPPVDYANRLLDKVYDFADDNRIWIE